MKTHALILALVCLVPAGGVIASGPATAPGSLVRTPSSRPASADAGRVPTPRFDVVQLATTTPESADRDDPMSVLSRSVKADLDRSNAQLNQLRGQIEREKLPLANELTELDDTLAQLRREFDGLSRQVDTGSLETNTLKGEIKLRQDELAYIGNLLDEYAKTFESKVNVCELQYCGEALQAAKDASTNNSLTQLEKLTRQMAFASLTTRRLFDAIGGMRFDGSAVSMEGRVVDGRYAMIGPVALFRANAGGVAGVVVPTMGSTRPTIRPLEGAMQAALDQVVLKGEGLMPLDPSKGAALRALVQKTSLIHIFERGGPIMWPLLIASILALGTVLERTLFMLIERFRRDPRALDDFLDMVREGNVDEALNKTDKSNYCVVRALNYALRHKEKSLANALKYSVARELKRYRRGLPVLGTVITLSPLLGLLGTVTGMMRAFSLVTGDIGTGGALTGGIGEALIATAFGLGIAIASVIPFNMLKSRSTEARHELEAASSQLELLLHPTPVRLRHDGDAPGRPERMTMAADAAMELLVRPPVAGGTGTTA